MATINVVDAGCGMGKTTSLINKINEDTSNCKWCFITPYLSEIPRIQQSCPDKHFRTPEAKGSKMQDVIKLFDKGENIVSTHALFGRFNEQIIDLARLHNYKLVIDEVVSVVDELQITKDDLKTIIKEYTVIKENSLLEWTAEKYEGKFEDYKAMIEIGGVVAHKSKSGEVISLMWMFPPKIIEAFKEVYLLTYLFDGQLQKAHCDFYNIKTKHLYIKDNRLTEEKQEYNYEEYKKLITVCNSNKLNEIGSAPTALSISWFERHKDDYMCKALKNNVNNFFKHITNVPSKQKLWTTFKDYQNIIQGKGYMKNFVPINIRATNEYKEATAVAYIANKYLRPTIKNFFIDYGVKIDEDLYALSELIQFVFRSAVRDKQPIKVYIPSKRMRTLFNNWLKQ